MKEQRSISVPGINLEENHHEEIEAAASIDNDATNIAKQQQHQALVRPTLFEVFIALKERENTETLTDQEIENKFTSLSLAFKTDKLTLTNRLELQLRQRDHAEKNIDAEISQLKKAIENLSRLGLDLEAREALNSVQQQVEVVKQSAERVSSSAEVYGAVQQEGRIARAIEIMLMHVENLKRIHDREHTELEESRKILHANNLSVEDHRRSGGLESSGSLSPSLGRPNSRGRSVSVIHPGQGSPTNTLGAALNSPKSTRRASVATHSQQQASANTVSPTFTISKANRKMGFASPIGRPLERVDESGSTQMRKRFNKDANSSQEENNNYTTQSKNTETTERPKIRSLSLIEPVKEEDENILMDEIDQLAKQRNSSLAPIQFRQTIKALRPMPYFHRLRDWYYDLYWPYDRDETILGLRYVATGLLLLAAFVSLIVTFVGEKVHL